MGMLVFSFSFRFLCMSVNFRGDLLTFLCVCRQSTVELVFGTLVH